MNNPTNPADKSHVVIQNGQRVSGPLSQQEAQKEADQRNQLLEKQGQNQQEGQAKVKQNLFG